MKYARGLTDIQLERLHARSSLHRMDFGGHAFASCFHCVRNDIPVPDLFHETADNGLTAICPHCHVDAILPGNYERGVLAQMERRYFQTEGHSQGTFRSIDNCQHRDACTSPRCECPMEGP